MKKTKLYIGLDVHKNSIQCGIARAGRSEPEVYAKWGGANLSVERGLNKLLKKFGLTKDQVAICYEAGPSGFVLARRLLQLKYDCIVVAPSKIPQKSGDKVKTDRSDCRKLARHHRSGDLTAVHIPPSIGSSVIRAHNRFSFISSTLSFIGSKINQLVGPDFPAHHVCRAGDTAPRF